MKTAREIRKKLLQLVNESTHGQSAHGIKSAMSYYERATFAALTGILSRENSASAGDGNVVAAARYGFELTVAEYDLGVPAGSPVVPQ